MTLTNNRSHASQNVVKYISKNICAFYTFEFIFNKEGKQQ